MTTQTTHMGRSSSEMREDESLVELLNRLEADAECIPLRSRRALAQSLAELVANGDAVALQVLYVMAADPCWEVRTDVAKLIRVVPEPDCSALSSLLADDTNAYVKRFAENAVKRRKSKTKPRRRKREPVEENDLAQAALEKVRRELGPHRRERP